MREWGAERVRREAAARREGPKGKGAPDPAAQVPSSRRSSFAVSHHTPFDRFVGGPSHNGARARAVGYSKNWQAGAAAWRTAIGYGIGT